MNYNPEQNPTYVNDRIQEYIDTVMHPNCETGKDKWTVESMVSWERFGSTICRKCHDNRERLHMMVNKFKDDYDAHVIETLLVDRQTTPYSEVPYQIRIKCERAIMDFEFEIYRLYNAAVFLPGKNGWTPDLLYKAGKSMFNPALCSPNLSEFGQEFITVNSIIDNAVYMWNLYHLRHINRKLAVENELLKTNRN